MFDFGPSEPYCNCGTKRQQLIDDHGLIPDVLESICDEFGDYVDELIEDEAEGDVLKGMEELSEKWARSRYWPAGTSDGLSKPFWYKETM